MTAAPYVPGESIRVWHTCAGHEPAHRTFMVERVKAMSGGHFRVTTTRCDGTQMDVEVDANGRDCDTEQVTP